MGHLVPCRLILISASHRLTVITFRVSAVPPLCPVVVVLVEEAPGLAWRSGPVG